MSKEKVTVSSQGLGKMGTPDDEKFQVSPLIAQAAGALACFVLWPMFIYAIILNVGIDLKLWHHAIVIVIAALFFFGGLTKIEPAMVGIPTFLDGRMNWFLFKEGRPWKGIFGVIVMPKKIYTTTVDVQFFAKGGVRMRGKLTFSFFIYNSFNHSQLDHDQTEPYKGGDKLLHADEKRVGKIIGEVFRTLGAVHFPEDLINMDTKTVIPELKKIIREIPGEEENDYRILLFGIEFAPNAFSFDGIFFESGAVAAAYETKKKEEQETKGEVVENKHFINLAKQISSQLGISPKDAMKMVQENRGRVKGINVNVSGTTSELGDHAAILAAGQT